MKAIIHFLVVISISMLLVGCAGTMLPVKPPANPPPAKPLKTQPRVALVLGSGGAKGYAHVGVIEALEEAGIKVDLLAGSSAGSLVAALYADNMSSTKTKTILLNAGFWDFAELSNVGLGGMVKGSNLESFLLKNMQARDFDHLHTKLLIATTDIKTGARYTIQSGPIAPSVLASSALPGVVTPVALYHRLLIDGGVVDPVPVDLVKPYHPKVIIAVNLSKMTDDQVPTTAFGVSSTAFNIMRRHLTEGSMRGADVVINPNVNDVTFDTSHRQEFYLAGLKAGRAAVPRIKQLLRERA